MIDKVTWDNSRIPSVQDFNRIERNIVRTNNTLVTGVNRFNERFPQEYQTDSDVLFDGITFGGKTVRLFVRGLGFANTRTLKIDLPSDFRMSNLVRMSYNVNLDGDSVVAANSLPDGSGNFHDSKGTAKITGAEAILEFGAAFTGQLIFYLFYFKR